MRTATYFACIQRPPSPVPQNSARARALFARWFSYLYRHQRRSPAFLDANGPGRRFFFFFFLSISIKRLRALARAQWSKRFYNAGRRALIIIKISKYRTTRIWRAANWVSRDFTIRIARLILSLKGEKELFFSPSLTHIIHNVIMTWKYIRSVLWPRVIIFQTFVL